MKGDEKFATVINCMDGRVQLPVIEWMIKKYGVDYVDSVTEPGPIKYLSEGEPRSMIESIRSRVDVSVNKHLSRFIAVAGHYDCAGNPVDKETQITQLKQSIKVIETWGFNTEIIGLWIDENWEVERVV